MDLRWSNQILIQTSTCNIQINTSSKIASQSFRLYFNSIHMILSQQFINGRLIADHLQQYSAECVLQNAGTNV